MRTTEKILTLVVTALDEMESVPLEATVRRTIRIAMLMGETETALRFSFDIKPIKGNSEANAADMKRLMLTDEGYTKYSADDPREKALRDYMDDRKHPDNQTVSIHTLQEMQRILDIAKKEGSSGASLEHYKLLHVFSEVLDRARARAFISLTSWERKLQFGNTNAAIFDGHKRRVDALLVESAPEIVDGFNVIYRRLNDAAREEKGSIGSAEELSQAVTTCRRILKTVADHVYPPTNSKSDTGNSLNDATYRNRIKEFTKSVATASTSKPVITNVDSIYERFTALDNFASKGVHAVIAKEEAESCVINTYILAGELLSLRANLEK